MSVRVDENENIFEVYYRNDAIKAARDLRYGQDVIDKIKAAKTDAEIDRIMRKARYEKFK